MPGRLALYQAPYRDWIARLLIVLARPRLGPCLHGVFVLLFSFAMKLAPFVPKKPKKKKKKIANFRVFTGGACETLAAPFYTHPENSSLPLHPPWLHE
jgi:hypothetical protein